MIEFKNSQGLTSSLNPSNLVELLYIDRQTSKSGTSLIFTHWSDETAETAEGLAARLMSQVRIVNFHILIDGKPSIPVWFNADSIIQVWETKTGHCMIVAEPRTTTLVAESYADVISALANAKVTPSQAPAMVSTTTAKRSRNS